jgi:kynureninase
MNAADFCLPDSTYLLNHSVGRPLKTAEDVFGDAYLRPWQTSGREPWAQWLPIIESFTQALATLFHGRAQDFCPQTNVSSGLTKLLMALPALQRRPVILMAEIDFPSMGFVMQHALSKDAEIRFLPKTLDVTCIDHWNDYLACDVDLAFISHAYSNTGQLAPINELVPLARSRQILTVIDVAQSAGVVPVDLAQLDPDFLLGSSVKWLCGGPGAAYLWVNPRHIDACQPRDVGWFSHENPFEFDIHHFQPQPTALKFWGGTPSIAPYALAAHSIDYFAHQTPDALRTHNQALITQVAGRLENVFASPRNQSQRSGTMILDFKSSNAEVLAQLETAGVCVDQREAGLRVSPHIYNTAEDMELLVTQVLPYCQ